MKVFSTQEVGPAVARNLRELDADRVALATRVSTLETNTTPSAWVEVGSGGSAPAFSGTWVNFDAANWQPVRYRKIGDIVYVEGIARSGTSGTAVFTLPVGFRPLKIQMFANVMNGVGSRLDVGSNGQVVPTGASTAFVSLNCSFSTI